MRAICTYVGCAKVATDYWDTRLSVICFLEGSLVVIFIYSLTDFNLLSKSFTSMIFLDGKLEKALLIQIISSTFNFEVCVYDFLLFLPVYGFGLAEIFLFGWERMIRMLVEGIKTLKTA